ncbi:MAG: hypothetical protein NTW96_24810 [Planctomycetia bacterium]|nr:hypothetical protein [Planctomycetia bacterium]
MNKPTNDRLANVLWETLRSPNEADQNGEPANVVDGLFAIARAIRSLASAVRETDAHSRGMVINNSARHPDDAHNEEGVW